MMGSLQGGDATRPSLTATNTSNSSSTVSASARIYACFAAGKPSPSNRLECYEPSTNNWHCMGVLPGVPDGHILKGFATIALDHCIYIIGGRLCRRETAADSNDHDTDVAVRPDMLRYDIRTGGWHSCSPLLLPRFDFASALCQGKIYVAGGQCALSGARGTAAAEFYDPEKDQWAPLRHMSALRYKCVGVAWQGSFHVVGGFATASACVDLGSSALERSSAEMYDAARGEWQLIAGMWQLDVPPNQIVAVEGRLFSSGDCLNCWKGHIEAYDGNLNIWSIVDRSELHDLSLLASLPPSAHRLYLTMAAVEAQLYFLVGYRVPAAAGASSSSRTVSLVHSFDTSTVPGTGPVWSSFQPQLVDQEHDDDDSKQLFSQCCTAQLST